MNFEKFKDDAYSVWTATFDDMIKAGMDAKDASESARNVLQQVLMAYGSLESDRLARLEEDDGR